ncbi:CLUMA_CG010029, isoform A [Clunio marinus]|uniref:Elongation of very long chain fatty acids protein n=1 Tax=Clunio marinus TaxID=568069 RepID=A0A1J1I930_9DIPT|nr:CLUMA_CG010029, isoform A [Clunio marinus]
MNSTEILIKIYKHECYINFSSLIILLLIFAAYLWFVLIAGPKYMKKREACNVTNLIRTYNIYQVFCCIFYVVGSYSLGFTLNHLFKCQRFAFLDDDARLSIYVGSWLFLSLRVHEFIETIFFILRKKFNQASFLHIFHHIGSVATTWLFIVSNAELMAVYIAQLNSAVHIIMYTYYFISSFKDKRIQNVISRVKPLITIIQLLQFVIIIAHCTIAILPDCGASYFFHLQILNFVILFILFGKFFVDTYSRSELQLINIKT